MNGHPFMLLEQQGALATSMHHLYHMLAHLRALAHVNTAYGLGLELPKESVITDLIDATRRAHEAKFKTDERKPA